LLNEKDKAKITLIGPPNSGKTTIKNVFFEMANPLLLLQKSLEPTKGVNTSQFSFFNLILGIFDLAGQENDIWFSKETDIFKGSNLIICVFDISTPLDSILHFLLDSLNLISRLKLTSSKVVILLHKIDLVKLTYPELVINFIKKQLEFRELKTFNIPIYKTSIAKDYFFDSYNSIYKILNEIFEKNVSKINKKEFNNLKKELSIILKCKNSIKYNLEDIVKNLNLNYQNAKFHLDRLEHLGFIKYPIFEPFSFSLTERAYWFKMGLKKVKQSSIDHEFNEVIEIIHTFLNLNKVYNSVS